LKNYEKQESVVYQIADNHGEYQTYKDFTTLDCWKQGRKVRLFFYNDVVKALPKEETFNLGSQIRNAAVSITANIAEGYGRFHYKESIQFYRISRGSLFELKDHLITCHDLEFITISTYKNGKTLIESALKTLNGYISYMNKLNK